MATIANWIQLGKEMGLKDKDLFQWAENREREEKEERKEKERLEREERQRDRDSKQAIAELELKRAEAERDAKRERGESSGSTSQTSSFKLPFFSEGVDNMDTYLSRFEMIATSAGVKEEDWAGRIMGLMRGKALDVCQKLSQTELSQYKLVKDALLKLYGNTADGYREKFHLISPSQNEDPQLFINNMSLYFDRWVALSEIGHTAADLRELVLIDKAIDSCHTNVASFIKERNPKTLATLTDILRTYKTAHPDRPIAKNKNDQSQDIVCFSSGVPSPSKRDSVSPRPNSSLVRDNYSRDIECFRCGKRGHISRQCFSNTFIDNRNRIKKNNDWRVGSRGATRDKVQQAFTVQTPGSPLSVHPGFVGGRAVQVLRDTGSTMVGVKSIFVKPHEFTGAFGQCMSFVGTVSTFPIAVIDIKTPFFSGKVKAYVIPDPPVDLIVGNIPNVVDLNKAEIDEWVKKNSFRETKVMESYCSYCRRVGHTLKDCCVKRTGMKSIVCYRCFKIGHKMSSCREFMHENNEGLWSHKFERRHWNKGKYNFVNVERRNLDLPWRDRGVV